jgi:hypothetical protein
MCVPWLAAALTGPLGCRRGIACLSASSLLVVILSGCSAFPAAHPADSSTSARSTATAARSPIEEPTPSSSPALASTPAPARTGRFVATGSMSTSRGTGFTATLLADGRVLVVGGTATKMSLVSPGLTSAETYDPATGKFTPTGSLLTRRQYHTATLLRDGHVLIAGGLPGNEGSELYMDPIAAAELYDPVTGKFTAAGSMKAGRFMHTATLLQDGRVLIVGGLDQTGNRVSSAEIYDPATGKFTPTGSMSTARAMHTATVLASGKVLIEGGGGIVIGEDLSSMPAELYDPVSGKFSVTGGSQPGRTGHASVLLPDGRVLVIGGKWMGDTWSAAVYDPASSTFIAVPVGFLPSGTGTLLDDRRVLLCGGYVPLGAPGAGSSAQAQTYDPISGSLAPTGSMITGRYGHNAILLKDGRVLIVGGGSSTGASTSLDNLASAELYEP